MTVRAWGATLLTMLSPDNSARDRTVRAAMDVVQARGVEHLTTRVLAMRLGLTQPALYRHFATKDELTQEVHRAVAALFLHELAAPLEASHPEDRLRRALGVFRRFAVEQPHYFDLLFVRPPLSGSGHNWGRGRKPSTIFQFLVDRVTECMRARVLRTDDPVSVAFTLAAHAQGLVVLYRRVRFRSEREFARFYDRSFECLLRGLR